jgi:membrane protein implicated in regulation of membrane protease activity
VDRAAAGGTAGGIAAIVAGTALVAAAVALIPFVGYALVFVAAWFGRRARRAQDRKYAGLRVLR